MKALKKYLVGTVLAMLFACVFIGVKAEAAAPGQVTGVKQVDASDSSIKVQWNYLEGSSLRYEVLISNSATGQYLPYNNTYTTSNYMYLNNRNAGITYYVKVRAYEHVYDSAQGKYVDTYGPESDLIKAVTAPATKPGKLYQTAATTTSISLKWNKVAGATGYQIYYKPDSGKTWKKTSSSTNTKKISGLSKNTSYSFEVYAVRKDGSYTAVAGSHANLSGIPTIPTAVTGIKAATYYNASQRVWLEWNKKTIADGYYYQLYDGNKKVKSGYITDRYSNYIVLDAKANKFYKVRVRAYVEIGGKKKVGDYSSWYYFAQQPDISLKSSTKALTASWKKTSGATSYTVYISNKQKSGYKKVGTTTKNSITIKKYGNSALKSGKKYYVYVVANKKVGSKTYKSDAQYCWYLTVK